MTLPVRRATIHEVAARAGVSHQTVSRYLRGNGGLKPATLERVRSAVAELDYRPNLLARSMRTRRSGRLAVLLPVAGAWLPLRLLSAASTAAHQAGFALDLVALEGGAAERAERVVELADSGQFEGVLALASLGERPPEGLGCPVRTLDGYDDALRSVGVLADGAAAGEVVRHLADLGHRHLLHLAGPASFASARNRRQSFLDAVAELGLDGDVLDGDWSAASGHQRIASLPAGHSATAAVAANDFVAMGAVRAAHERGWSVPGDLSVVGWDDEELGRYATPALSTVAVDRERQGREAVQQLVAAVRGEPVPAGDPASLHTLIPRESSGAPLARGRAGVSPG